MKHLVCGKFVGILIYLQWNIFPPHGTFIYIPFLCYKYISITIYLQSYLQ